MMPALSSPRLIALGRFHPFFNASKYIAYKAFGVSGSLLVFDKSCDPSIPCGLICLPTLQCKFTTFLVPVISDLHRPDD